MILLEGTANFTAEENGFIEYVKGNQFPWYFGSATTNYKVYTHTFMEGVKDRKFAEGVVTSEHTHMARGIVERILTENGVNMFTIHRISINASGCDVGKHGDIHEDHTYPHKNLLVYLNRFDRGHTYLFDKAGNVTDEIIPAEDKFVIFNGCRHAQGFPSLGQRRLVLVATFGGEASWMNT